MASNYIIHLDETYRLRVDQHPLLDLPPQERFAAQELRNDFAELLLKYMGVNPSFDETEANVSLLPLLENEAVDRLLGGKLIYDNEAFMETLSYTLEKCDAKKTESFCHYFMNIYRKRLPDAEAELVAQKKGGSRKDRDFVRRTLKPLEDILRETGKNAEDLSDDEIEIVADVMNAGKYVKDMTPDRIRIAIKVRRSFNSVSLDAGSDDDRNDQTAEGDFLLFKGHRSSDDECDSINDMPDVKGAINIIIHLLDDILDPDKKEYPQLFINHGLLSMLKDKTDDPNGNLHETIKDAYQQREKELYEKVFLYDYLLFVLEQPPQPDTIEHMDKAEFKEGRAYMNKAICEYKNKDKSTVSGRYKKFKAAYLEITKRQLYGW